MKKIITNLVLAMLVLQINLSCSDDNNTNSTASDVATAESFKELSSKAIESRKQTFSFKTEDGEQVFTSKAGVKIKINGNCLLKNGKSVSGEVVLEYIELFKNADMLLTGRATMGKDKDGNLKLLVSGGAFYIQAYQGKEKLELNCPINLEIPSSLTGDSVDPAMVLWRGTITDNNNIVWEEKIVDANNQIGNILIDDIDGDPAIPMNENIYNVFFDQFGWTNVDKFYDYTGEKTTIKVTVPDEYNQKNSSVYLHYDGEGSALAYLDTFDEATNTFSEHYGYIPVGLNTHIIFATEKGKNWLYAIKAVKIEKDAIYTFAKKDLKEVTEQEFKEIIMALP